MKGVEEEWNIGAAFKILVEHDTAAWKRLGADRSPFFVQPSGPIKSPLAVHRLNPTFHVADPLSTVTDDLSNPTIRLLHDCGLSSSHCFMFDEIIRRDRTKDCLFFYTEDLRRPHKDFARSVRKNMSAAVGICFEEEVFKEVLKAAHLVRFPLWGIYKSVRLWLEFNDSNQTSMKRFVL